LYVFIRENGGWSNFKMEEIEKYPCYNLNEARKREYYWYKILSPKLNTNLPWFDIDKNKEKLNKSYITKYKNEKNMFGIFTLVKPNLRRSSHVMNQCNNIKTVEDIKHIKMSNLNINFTDPEVIKFFKTNDLSTPDILVKSLIRNYLTSKEPEKPKPVEPPQITSDETKITITYDKLKNTYEEHNNLLNQHKKMNFLVKQLCRDFQTVNAQTNIKNIQEMYEHFANEKNIVHYKCDDCKCYTAISKKSLSAHKRHCARFMKSKINDEPPENDDGIVEENENGDGIVEENENDDKPDIK
jgi:hypothetical protein